MPLARFFGLLQIFIAGRDLRVGIIACLRAVTHRQACLRAVTHRQALRYLTPWSYINREVSLPGPVLD